ncbi:hypothetical protein [Caballeronia novacaledonica]|uniref:Uncharacterized protein n=1 Tax=Caballeronia novacaledonica TaxID=1544861 RepID=A0AA37I974_9BURK|nr:hypothetical protein [Caballeronia novacaledonica]GJH25442.1 hypothetical protein CBA19CS42_13020 [Caballeronia novacaledonica]
MIQEIRLANRSLTLRRRRDVHFTSGAEEHRAEKSGQAFLAGSFEWMRDKAFMSKLKELLNIDEADPSKVRRKVQRAFELGEVVTIPDPPNNGLRSGRDGDAPKPRAATFTPSQLFKNAPRIARTGSYYDRPLQPRLFADDCMAAWLAKPGDLLPDVGGDSDQGGSLLDDAQTFDYQPDIPDGDLEELAGTTNERYAAKMLGYDSSTFREMIHRFKRVNGVGPKDDLEFEKNGDVSLDGEHIDNLHDYGN